MSGCTAIEATFQRPLEQVLGDRVAPRPAETADEHWPPVTGTVCDVVPFAIVKLNGWPAAPLSGALQISIEPGVAGSVPARQPRRLSTASKGAQT